MTNVLWLDASCSSSFSVFVLRLIFPLASNHLCLSEWLKWLNDSNDYVPIFWTIPLIWRTSCFIHKLQCALFFSSLQFTACCACVCLCVCVCCACVYAVLFCLCFCVRASESDCYAGKCVSVFFSTELWDLMLGTSHVPLIMVLWISSHSFICVNTKPTKLSWLQFANQFLSALRCGFVKLIFFIKWQWISSTCVCFV